MNSVISTFLRIAQVRHTKSYLDNITQTHPNKNNMLGLKQVLDVYGVDTVGVKFDDKASAGLVFPCILHISGGFVVAKDLHDDTITYVYNGKVVTKPVADFCNIWTGYALLPASDFSTAIEPNYISNRKKEVQSKLSRAFIYSLPVFVWLIMFATYLPNYSVAIGAECALEWIGLLLCYFLMEKQLFKKSSYGDKVCSAFHLNNCNDVLFSDKSKIGILSWSEIGFGYFVARLICRIIIPQSQVPLALIGWIAMLYGVWSIWQQTRVLRNFCLLCTLVQVVVWIIGIVDICISPFDNIIISRLIVDMLISGSVIILSILSTHAVTSYYTSENERKEALWKLNSIKADSDVFQTKLQKEEYYRVSDNDSHIIWGNKESNIRITIFSNPHCNPCARMHKRVDEMLKTHGDKLCVQYVFTSFNEELEESSRFLIASYLQLDTQTSQSVYQQWFDGEKNNAKEFMNHIAVDAQSEETESEYRRHKEWSNVTGLRATPTVLVNGYMLPDGYEIEDLIFLT